jgi:hypothetical protein
MRIKWFIILLSIGLILLASCASEIVDKENMPVTLEDEVRGIKITAKGVKYLVSPNDLLAGGPPKDGIPSLDSPSFVTVEEANEWIDDKALVLAFRHKGIKRVYPLQVMTWHEIVNENIAGDPILITYCPLCGSGIAYERKINGQEVEFGTSGKLYNSNLVMYDRLTDSYWTQIGGEAIIGELTGTKLTLLSLETVEWGEWKTIHPDSEVLSKDTGFVRDYTSVDGPYANYFADDFYLFPGIQNLDKDKKLANKEFVYGITLNNKFKAYPKRLVEEKISITDEFAGTTMQIERNKDGSVTFTNTQTNKEIPKEVDFWFAWFTFHPDTEVLLD